MDPKAHARVHLASVGKGGRRRGGDAARRLERQQRRRFFLWLGRGIYGRSAAASAAVAVDDVVASGEHDVAGVVATRGYARRGNGLAARAALRDAHVFFLPCDAQTRDLKYERDLRGRARIHFGAVGAPRGACARARLRRLCRAA